MREAAGSARESNPELSEEEESGSPFVGLQGKVPPRHYSRSSRTVAWLMDELVSIPGTRIKFGLDPVIGLFSALGLPVGDAASNIVSSVSLVAAIRRGLPFRTTLRILGNILVNSGAGSIPVAGDLFSLMFRSNSRNRDIIEEFLAGAELAGRKPSWWRMAGSLLALALTILLAAGMCLAMYFLVVSKIWSLLGTEVETIFH